MNGPLLLCGLDRLDRPITLRPPMIKEANIHRSWMADPAVTRYLGHSSSYTLKEEQAWLRRNRDSTDSVLWSIWVADVLIGNTGIRLDLELKTGVTGIVIGNRDYWYKGIATSVFANRSRYAFTELGLVALFTEAFEPNEGSWRAAERAGYVRYGTKPFAKLVDGVYVRSFQACLSREHWRELNPDQS